MSNHTTADILASNIDAFAARNSYLDANGNRVYLAHTWLNSETPNGHYTITKSNSRHWSVSHHQVINGGKQKVVRYISFATTKEVAMRYAQLDSHDLAENVLKAMTNGKGVFSA